VVFPTVITPADFLDSDEEEEEAAKKKAGKTPGAASKQKSPASKSPAVGGGAAANPRAACRYGAGCYRKNPRHFQLEAHPGDADYAEPEEGGGEDDKRPECEYGLKCYRKNPDHKKRYKHTRRPQPKRKAKVGENQSGVISGAQTEYSGERNSGIGSCTGTYLPVRSTG
jgi:PBZ domain